jgi:hypothetical protein
MGYVPKDAEWYIVDLIIEMRIEGEERNVVHVNTMLVRADSPERAFDEALKLGVQHEDVYENTDGKRVSVKFRGLAHLDVIHDSLEHGAELTYSQKVGLSEDEIAHLVVDKAGLALFSEQEPFTGPNYAPKCIMDRLIEELSRHPSQK